jgi:hypothetical protein
LNPSPVSYSFKFLELRLGGGAILPLLPPGGENSSFSPFLGDYCDVFLVGADTFFLGACAFGFFFFFRIQQQQHVIQQHIGANPTPNITTKKIITPIVIAIDGNPNIAIKPAEATAIKKR